jgi:Mce-associated membrane protein
MRVKLSRGHRADSASSEVQPVKESIAAPVDTQTTHPPTDAAGDTTPDVAESKKSDTDAAHSEDDATKDREDAAPATTTPKRRMNWTRALVFGVLPAMAMLLALAAGFLKYQDFSARESEVARVQSVQTAKDSTIAMLSYRPDTVDRDLSAARDRLTGSFRDSYTQLTKDVVIPGAKQKQISAVASVPAAASVSANPNHAVALVFVNQTVIIGQQAPSDTASSVRVTMDKVGGRWLIAGFDPV